MVCSKVVRVIYSLYLIFETTPHQIETLRELAESSTGVNHNHTVSELWPETV